MPDGPTAPVHATGAEMNLIQPVTDKGKLILRAKQVQSVAFNEALGEIIVFTKRLAPSSKRQLAELPQTIENIKIRYRQGAAICSACRTDIFGSCWGRFAAIHMREFYFSR
jgi:hypothetical protein